MTNFLANNLPDSPQPLSQDRKRESGLSPTGQAARPRFVINLTTVLGGQVACAALSLLVEVCFARLLGPEGRGKFSLALMAATFGVLLGGLGGEIPITVWAADAKKRIADWLPAVLFLGILGSTVAICMWILAFWRWRSLYLKGITPILFFLVLATIPMMILFGYLSALLAGAERFRTRAFISFIEQLAGLIAILAFVLFIRRSPEMAVLGNLVGLIVAVGAAAFVLRHSLVNSWKLLSAYRHLIPALSLGTRGQLGNLASFFNYRLDVFIVNAFLGPTQVGLYALGVVVSEALWQVPNAAAVALLPRTARTLETGANEFTCSITRQVLLLACTSGLAMAALCPLVIPLVFGEAFRESIPVIWWILPGTIALCLGKVISADLAGRKKPEYSSVFALVALVVTIVLDFRLIPAMGIRGAALASSIAYFLNTVLLAFALKYELKVRWRFLFIPSRLDFVPYRLAWHRLKSWIGQAFAVTDSGSLGV
jgi:O-antigen/teichoic acid export membrane protein